MSARRPASGAWPLERKFALWLADRGLSLHAFARRHGFAQQTLHGWMKMGVRLPARGLGRIARATGLPEAYWLDADVPYPPPLDFLNARDRAMGLLATLDAESLAWVLEVCADRAKLRQARALWEAAKGGSHA